MRIYPYNLSGVILAGGENSRIGLNKAYLKLDGQTFIERIIDVLRPVCREIIIVSNGKELYPGLPDCRVIHTRTRIGPVAGIYEGLKAAGSQFSLCTACDIPFIHRGIVSEIVQALTPDVQVVAPRYRGLLEPLCAAYSRECTEAIAGNMRQGKHKIQDFFDKVKVKEIPEKDLIKHDPQGYTFFNINRMEDYRKAQEIFQNIACSGKT
ncbi:MAG: molybdenum cofactor guanylyltransferase [bacterium]